MKKALNAFASHAHSSARTKQGMETTSDKTLPPNQWSPTYSLEAMKTRTSITIHELVGPRWNAVGTLGSFKVSADHLGKLQVSLKDLKQSAKHFTVVAFGDPREALDETLNPNTPHFGAGAGELTIKIEPENSGLCCAIKKRGETQHWKDRWAVLAGDVIHYFGDKDEGASKATINLAEAKDITHPEDILELIDVETDEKTWHFRLETPEFGAAALNAFRLAAGKSAYAGTGVSIADQGGFQENVKVTQD